MALAKDYASVMGRNNEIMKEAMGLDYDKFESGKMRFDYEGLMASTGYTLEEIEKVQSATGVGNTPILELRSPRQASATPRSWSSETSPRWRESTPSPVTAPPSWQRMKPPTPPVPSRPEELPAQSLPPRRWATRALWPLPPATTAQPSHPRPPCRDLSASSFRNAMTPRE